MFFLMHLIMFVIEGVLPCIICEKWGGGGGGDVLGLDIYNNGQILRYHIVWLKSAYAYDSEQLRIHEQYVNNSGKEVDVGMANYYLS